MTLNNRANGSHIMAMNSKIKGETKMTYEEEVASWPIKKQIDIITQALNQATEKAARTNDPAHWAVVDGWEKRLMDTINCYAENKRLREQVAELEGRIANVLA